MAACTSFRRLTGESRSATLQENGVWEVTETWQGIFDGEVTDPLDFLGDPLIPALWTPHPNNALLYLKGCPNVVPPIKDSLRALNFTLVWSTGILAAADKHEPQKYEDSIRATKSWSHRVVQFPVEEAYVSDDDGATFSMDKIPIQNTMYDLVIPGVTRNRYMPTCRYSRNELVVPTGVLDLPGLINNDAITLDGKAVAIGTAMIIAAPVSAQKRDLVYDFRTVDYEFLIKEEGWDEKILNRGFYCRHIPSNVKERCKVKNGIADETADERPLVNSEEPVALDIDDHDRRQVEDELSGTFVEHYRFFRHLTYTSFGALGFS